MRWAGREAAERFPAVTSQDSGMRRVVVSVADMHFYMAKLYYSLFREGRVKVLEDERGGPRAIGATRKHVYVLGFPTVKPLPRISDSRHPGHGSLGET